MEDQHHGNQHIGSYILSGSTTMVGVCITVITLFKVMKGDIRTIADDMLGLDTFIFIAASILAYASLRNPASQRLKRWADILFFTGMILMLGVGVIVVYTTY